MKRTFDPSSAAKILRDGIAKGYWTLEDLDNAPPGTALNYAEYRQFLVAQKYSGKAPVYRNLLRELGDVKDNQQDDFIL
jgi:hypothetical protein